MMRSLCVLMSLCHTAPSICCALLCSGAQQFAVCELAAFRFGNSNMPRNPDSSRFGKLYKLFFNKQAQKLTGCNITPYMLEKSR